MNCSSTAVWKEPLTSWPDVKLPPQTNKQARPLALSGIGIKMPDVGIKVTDVSHGTGYVEAGPAPLLEEGGTYITSACTHRCCAYRV